MSEASPMAQSNTLGQITPEARAGIWARLDALARSVRDEETRSGYLSAWRTRFEAAFPLWTKAGGQPGDVPTYQVAQLGGERPLAMPSTSGVLSEDGTYFYPDEDDVSAAKLRAIVTRVKALREERKEIVAQERDVFAMAKLIGFDVKALRRAIADEGADSEMRQSVEASLVVYRKVLGIEGPMDAAMLPPAIDVRAKLMNSAQAKRSAKIGALIDMRSLS